MVEHKTPELEDLPGEWHKKCTGFAKLLVLREGGKNIAKQRRRALHDERFFQLSQDMSTLRWSWTDYLLIDEVLDVRYDTAKPCVFAIHYAHNNDDGDLHRHQLAD